MAAVQQSMDIAEDSAVSVPAAVVQAALRAADALGKDVADVPVVAIAREAGVSRSTMLRRLGGSRAALDDAVRAAGIDPGGQPPVPVRALDATAALISQSGLTAVTLEAVAARAHCSVHSLYATFGGRDDLVRAVFERHTPLLDIEEFLDDRHGDLTATVRRIYQMMAQTLGREPRVAPAMFGETLARPDSPAVQSLIQHSAPRMFGVLGHWLSTEIDAGRILDLPIPLLVQQLVAPMLIHMLIRPAVATVPAVQLPDLNQTCDIFAEAFVRAVTT